MTIQTTFADLLALDYDDPERLLRYGDSPLQFAEGWHSRSEAPTLLMIHGGCWLSDYDLTHIRPLCSAIRNLGINVWSLEYRRIGDEGGGWPGTFEDVLAGLAVIRREVSSASDRGEFWLAGHSAGGHLAVWASTRSQNSVTAGDAGGLPEIGKTIGLAAILDLETYAAGESGCEQATVSLLGGEPGAQPKRYIEAAPIRTNLNRGIYLLHGTDDKIVGPEHASWFTDASQAVVTEIEGAGHFDLVNPGSSAFSYLQSALMPL